MIKTTIDSIAKRKAKFFLMKTAQEKGLDLEQQMTDNINLKLDDLLQALIDDIGYKDLAKLGMTIQ